MSPKKNFLALFVTLLIAFSSFAKFQVSKEQLVLTHSDVKGMADNLDNCNDIANSNHANMDEDLFDAATYSAGGIIYVKQNATGDGSSWNNATGDLQAAINAVGVTEVWVAKGEYQPVMNGSFTMKSNVKIYGGFPDTGTPGMGDRNWRLNETILNGNGSRVINNNAIMNANAVLDGFTVSGGTLTANTANIYGAGMLNAGSSSPTIANCTFKQNVIVRASGGTSDVFGKGGGIANLSSSPVITNCVFLDNIAFAAGGGIYNENAIPTIRNCVFAGNRVTGSTSSNGGGGIANAGTNFAATIRNCLFVANEAYVGAGLYNSSGSVKNQEIVNCLFYNNTANNVGKQAIHHNNTAFTFVNTIVWGNTGTTSVGKQNGPDPIVKYSLMQGMNSTLDGNLDATNANNAPQFINAANTAGVDGFYGTTDDGLILAKTSPLINRGDNTLYGANLNTDKDLLGNARLQKGSIDIGVYESAYNPVPIPDVNGVIYVRSGGNGNYIGGAWANAAPELADALVAAKSNVAIKEVWLAEGTYKPLYSPGDINFGMPATRDNAFLMVKDVKIYGGFAATGNPLLADRNHREYTTILSGDLNNNNLPDNTDIYHVLIAAGDVGAAILDGLTIRNGFAVAAGSLTVGGKAIPKQDGGALVAFESSPKINNCIFEQNVAGTHGGAISNLKSSPEITNGIFRANESQSGGAIYNEQNSSPKIVNSLFYGNDANFGLDIQNYDKNSNDPTVPVIINSTFYNTKNAAKFHNDGENVDLKIYNCIIWGGGSNQITNTNSWDTPNANAILANTLIEGGHAGTGNLNQNPLFTNEATQDFSLQLNSPAKNVGSNAWFQGLAANTKDLAGKDRVYDFANGGIIDMGAYENQNEGVLPVELGSYTATIEARAAKLQWFTISETDNKEFIISRSNDGSVFNELVRLPGKGMPSAYVYYDYSPLSGVNYYRLAQLDFNGKPKVIGDKVLRFGFEGNLLSAYPNPSSALVNINLDVNTYVEARLYSLSGKQLVVEKLTSHHQNVSFDLSKLPAGLYLVKLFGTETKTVKVTRN